MRRGIGLFLRAALAAASLLGSLPAFSQGATIYANSCSTAGTGCHSPTPDLARFNAAGAPEVIVQANSAYGMGFSGAFLTANKQALADYFNGLITSTQTVNVPYHGSTGSFDVNDIYITSVITALNRTQGPTQGTISPAGASNATTTYSYTHTANNCTGDVLKFQGTGLTTTTVRTVNVSVTPPAAPVPNNIGPVNIAYSTGGTTIPVSASGFASSVQIASQPSAGMASAGAGLNVVYTASSTTYSPTVSFTYRAVGPCGAVSATTGTVTVNVGLPPAPTTAPRSITVQANTTSNISVAAQVSGIADSVSIVTPPTSGSAGVSGTPKTFTYTPNTNFSGSDSFTYKATGPGGDSNISTVTITVSPAPFVSNTSVTVPFNSTTAINLAPLISGSYDSINVTSGPGHGTYTITAPATVNYTSTTGYSGPDSFTYTATSNVNGTSTPATVTITVNPPAPVANNRTVTIPFGTPTPLDMTSSVTGTATSVSVVTPPAHGTATANGMVITYAPGGTYSGPDTFTYKATGPGGDSAPATVSLTISAPTAPVARSLSVLVPFQTATAIDLLTYITGLADTISIVTPPAHGTVALSGKVVIYTPAGGYAGPDSFTYKATGIGGSSTPATVSIAVGLPGPPSAAASSATVPFNTPLTIDLGPQITGYYTSIAITVPPGHGTATVSGSLVTYVPAAGYSGPDGFTYVASGPGGSTAPTAVSLTVQTQPPVAAATTMVVALNSAGTVDLAPYISGSGVTGVAISTAPAHGRADVNGTKVTYTPNNNFFGQDSFKYVAFGNAGDSPPATISVTVVGRPDPTKDPNVASLATAQASTAQRFARAQINSFQQRMESLHVAAPEAPGPSASRAAPSRAASDPFRDDGRVLLASAGGNALAGAMPGTTSALSAALANSIMSLAASQSMGLNGATVLTTGVNVWIAGNLRFGHRDPTSASDRLRFTTDGVSAGIDRRYGDRLALGVGLGFARDRTEFGSDGSKSTTDGTAVAAYGSYQAARNTFIDGLVGYASLDMDSDRFMAPMGRYASGSRKGDQWFGSLAAGYEHRRGGLLLSPYARLDYASTRLKQGVESGEGGLVFFPQTLPMFQATVGVRAESQHDTRYGAVRPRARVEFSHDFEGERDMVVAYADEFGTRYTVTPAGVKRNALLLGIGSDFILGRGLRLGIDYQARRTSHADIDQGIRLQITQALDGRGAARWLGGWSTLEDPLRIDAGYAYDDNVTRAREARDKLADHIFSVNVSKGRIFPLNANTRVVASVFGNLEELYRYTGLGRASAGFQAELQYRASGDFDAVTWGVQGRAVGDYYDTPIRRGYRYSLALTARRSLTDRIEAFAALTGSIREGKSAVFDLRDYGAKVNLDYSLGGPNGSIYLAGEYRRGDAVSSGRFSLDNIDIADYFTPDEAFGPGFFAYRFEAKTWLGTLGYNRPLGPRDAIDFSWRRVQSTPVARPGYWNGGPFRYIDNQYSIIYLMRF